MSEGTRTVKEVVAGQLGEAMKELRISKNRMATMLGTSRTQVDRLLNGKDDVTLGSLERAAAMVGRRVRIELVSKEGAALQVDVRQIRVRRDEAASDTGHPQVEVVEEFGWLG
jgi:transcriptional regulator with XRE-family HTH domain